MAFSYQIPAAAAAAVAAAQLHGAISSLTRRKAGREIVFKIQFPRSVCPSRQTRPSLPSTEANKITTAETRGK